MLLFISLCANLASLVYLVHRLATYRLCRASMCEQFRAQDCINGQCRHNCDSRDCGCIKRTQLAIREAGL